MLLTLNKECISRDPDDGRLILSRRAGTVDKSALVITTSAAFQQSLKDQAARKKDL